MDHRRADVLGDAAGLSVRDMRIADRVQQGSLAVVNMTHDTDDRRSGDQILLLLVLFFQQVGDDILLLLMLAEDLIIHRDLFRLIVGEILIHRDHLSCHEQFFDDGGRLYFHLVRKFLQRQVIRKHDRLDLLFHDLHRLGFMERSGAVRILLAAAGLHPVIGIEPVVLLVPVLPLSSSAVLAAAAVLAVLVIVLAALGRGSASCTRFPAACGNRSPGSPCSGVLPAALLARSSSGSETGLGISASLRRCSLRIPAVTLIGFPGASRSRRSSVRRTGGTIALIGSSDTLLGTACALCGSSLRTALLSGLIGAGIPGRLLPGSCSARSLLRLCRSLRCSALSCLRILGGRC